MKNDDYSKKLFDRIISEIEQSSNEINSLILLSNEKEGTYIAVSGDPKLLSCGLLNSALKNDRFADLLLKTADDYLSIKEAEVDIEKAVKDLVKNTLGGPAN